MSPANAEFSACSHIFLYLVLSVSLSFSLAVSFSFSLSLVSFDLGGGACALTPLQTSSLAIILGWPRWEVVVTVYTSYPPNLLGISMNSDFFCLYLPGAKITGTNHHAWFYVVERFKPNMPARQTLYQLRWALSLPLKL